MILRGIDFGYALGASGVQGFFGEGYRQHRWWGPLAPDFRGLTFVAKTVTWYPRTGNMRLQNDATPKDAFPDCIRANLRAGAMLNAVGLSNHGLPTMLRAGLWQRRMLPFMLSFAVVGDSPRTQEAEARNAAEMLAEAMSRFQGPFGIQLNASCPNTSHARQAGREARLLLDAFAPLGVPLLVKVNVLLSHRAVLEIGEHPACDGIVVSNTLPWGTQMPNTPPVPWKELFGERSPLGHLGGGGLSGEPLRRLVAGYVSKLRHIYGFRKAINAGGGLLCPDHVDQMFAVGADSVFLGSVAMLRPWRVAAMIRRANRTGMQHRATTKTPSSGHTAPVDMPPGLPDGNELLR